MAWAYKIFRNTNVDAKQEKIFKEGVKVLYFGIRENKNNAVNSKCQWFCVLFYFFCNMNNKELDFKIWS